eukprot:3844518-Ditylum_brightwellii.AAC.1
MALLCCPSLTPWKTYCAVSKNKGQRYRWWYHKGHQLADQGISYGASVISSWCKGPGVSLHLKTCSHSDVAET